MASTDLQAVLIAGPTASGKSALALEIAERRGGVVINADSMQVYAELRILTARPSPQDEARVPHRLYGRVSAREAYSAGRFVRDVADLLPQLATEGRLPIIVGGTGLYFKALLEGLAPIPDIPSEVRRAARDLALRMPALDLYRMLSERDPQTAARLTPGDTQRIIRALEVLEATGRPLSEWQRLRAPPLIDEDRCERLLLMPPRLELVERAEHRFDAMMQAGALDEVRQLVALGLDRALPAMRALGVPQLAAHLAGAIELKEAVAEAKAETRQYIKRQRTWMRRHMIAWRTVQAQ